MEQQKRIDSLSRMPRRTKTSHLGKTTRKVRVHVQTVGLNAEKKKIGIEPEGSTFLLTFVFIGLRRQACYQALREIRDRRLGVFVS